MTSDKSYLIFHIFIYQISPRKYESLQEIYNMRLFLESRVDHAILLQFKIQSTSQCSECQVAGETLKGECKLVHFLSLLLSLYWILVCHRTNLAHVFDNRSTAATIFGQIKSMCTKFQKYISNIWSAGHTHHHLQWALYAAFILACRLTLCRSSAWLTLAVY